MFPGRLAAGVGLRVRQIIVGGRRRPIALHSTRKCLLRVPSGSRRGSMALGGLRQRRRPGRCLRGRTHGCPALLGRRLGPGRSAWWSGPPKCSTMRPLPQRTSARPVPPRGAGRSASSTCRTCSAASGPRTGNGTRTSAWLRAPRRAASKVAGTSVGRRAVAAGPSDIVAVEAAAKPGGKAVPGEVY